MQTSVVARLASNSPDRPELEERLSHTEVVDEERVRRDTGSLGARLLDLTQVSPGLFDLGHDLRPLLYEGVSLAGLPECDRRPGPREAQVGR